jgi:hypothetical protein
VLIDCAKKSIKLTTLEGKEMEFVAEPVLAVIKYIYLPATYLHFMQDIEDRCL